MVDGQSYFLQPTIFVPPATWENVRPQSEADLDSDTPYPNIISVRLTDPSQVDVVRPRLLSNVANIEVTDIATTINIPGYSAQQGTAQTQGFFTLLIGVLVIGGFFQIQILQKVLQIGGLKAIGGGLTYLFSLGFPPTIPLIFNGVHSLIAIALLLFIGPSGSGKTTMLSILAALLSPTSGQVPIDGQDLARMNQKRRVKLRREKIGFTFQANNLIPF